MYYQGFQAGSENLESECKYFAHALIYDGKCVKIYMVGQYLLLPQILYTSEVHI